MFETPQQLFEYVKQNPWILNKIYEEQGTELLQKVQESMKNWETNQIKMETLIDLQTFIYQHLQCPKCNQFKNRTSFEMFCLAGDEETVDNIYRWNICNNCVSKKPKDPLMREVPKLLKNQFRWHYMIDPMMTYIK